MSTGANIVFTDGFDELWFYRHSDGYPDCVLKDLEKLIGYVRDGAARGDIGQLCGWLIIMGNREYSSGDYPGQSGGSNSWKAGAYEPTTGEHGDIAFLYEVDLEALTIKVVEK